MHICVVTEDFLPNIGGMSQHVFEIGRCMVQMGHTVTVVNQLLGSHEEKTEDYDGMRVVRRQFDWPVRKIRIVPYSIKLRREIMRQHAREPIDIVHWHDLRAGTAVKYLRLKCPTVFTNHSSAFLLGMNRTLDRQYFRFSLAHADRFIAPSQELADETFRQIGCKAVYIPNGYDPERYFPFNSDDLRQEVGIAENDKVLLVPRRLAPKNGVLVLAKALPSILSRHPETLMLVTGGGFPEERERIEEVAKQHDCLSRIKFMDGVDNALMPRYYNLADLVIMPSFMEAVSLSAIEAMACGKCVIASDVGGLSQLFANPSHGRLVPSGQPGLLSEAIVELIDDSDRRKQIGKDAQEHVFQNYTWRRAAESTLAVYRGELAPN